MSAAISAPQLERKTFTTSRLADFTSQAELTKQTSHRIQVWLLVEIQELIDNALDAAEEAGTGRPSVCVGPTSTLEAFPVPAGMECLTIFGGLRLAATKRGGQ